MTSRTKNPDAAVVSPHRRLFLQGSIAGVVAASLPGCSQDVASVEGPIDLEAAGQAKVTTVSVVRPADLLVLTFRFVNLDHVGKQLVVIDPKTPTLVVVELPPQHFHEEAFDEFPGSPAVLPTSDVAPVRHRMAGLSRLVFRVPQTTSAIDFDLEKVLATISGLDLSISKNAGDGFTILTPPGGIGIGTILGTAFTGALGSTAKAPATLAVEPPASLAQVIAASTPVLKVPSLPIPPIVIPIPPALLPPAAPVAPSSLETSLELPYRLQISPGATAAFAHELKAVPRGRMARVELWHTRLGVRMSDRSIDETEKTAGSRTFRALWNRDRNNGVAAPFGSAVVREPLRPLDRTNIVDETSNFTLKLPPRKVRARRMMLTSLGGYLDSIGVFNGQTGMLGWDHRAAMGRDSYVRREYDGHLFPFGHRASLITITERKLLASHPRRAFLWQRSYIVVKEPVIAYPAGSDTTTAHGPLRKNPFTALEVTTLTTPNFTNVGGGSSRFCPEVGVGVQYRFSFAATDRTNNVVKFDAPAIWVPTTDSVARATLDSEYTAVPSRSAGLGGQRVGFAPVVAPAPGTTADADPTSFATKAMTFLGTTPADVGTGLASRFAPTLDEAQLSIPAISAITGDSATKAFSYAQRYADHAFDAVANQGEVLLAFAGAEADRLQAVLSAQADKVGGFVAPDLAIAGISRKIGPIAGDIEKIASGNFEPADFFALLNGAKLFGTFGLGDVLQATGLDAAPKFLTETANTALAFVKDALALYNQAQAFVMMAQAKAPSLSGEAQARVNSLVMRLQAVVTAAEKLTKIEAIDPTPAGLSAQLTTLRDSLDGLDLAVRAVTELPEPAKREIVAAITAVRGLLTSSLSVIDDLTKLIADAQKGLDLAQNMTVKLAWEAPMKPYGIGSKPQFIPNKPLKLSGEIRAKASHGRPAGIDLTCSLEDFSLDLVGNPSFMVLHFEHILFKLETGKKPDIDVKFGGLTFTGPLAFVENLRKVIPLDGFSDPPALDISPKGIEASFSMALPNVSIGVFSLANISIGAGFKVPFIGDPLTVRFNFCTKEHPFLLTVSLLGGGGFFSIVLSPKGVDSLEAALEFGASLSLDFGVASGEITVMAGIYLKMAGEAVTLTGYLRMRGEVDVLGLISASIELRMELTYESATKKVIGRASLEIEVEVLFFSTTVTVSCERRFKSSEADPTFRDLYGATYVPCPPQMNAPSCVNAWDQYVHAFAD